MAAKLRPAKLRLLLLLCFQGVAVLQAMDLACVPSIWRHPLSGPYVDLTLYLRPASTPVDSSANTGIRIEIMVYHKDGIRAFDKYVLRKNATTKSDTSSPMTSGDWADLRRFYLPPGRYGLEIRAVSLWDTLDRAVLSKELMVDTPTTGPSLSAPILLHAWCRSSEASRWNRHGFFLMARPDLPYRRTLDTMAFYTEVHLDSTKAGRYLLQYALQDQDGRVVGARQAFSRIPVGKQVHAVLGTWPLADLDPGTYRLVMELKDSTNTTLDQKTVSVVRWRLDGWAKNGLLAVQGRPGDATQDSLQAWEQWLMGLDSNAIYRQCMSLRPLCDTRQRGTLDRLANTQPKDRSAMQNFVYHFWKGSGEQGAVSRWMAYQEEVDKTVSMFSSRITTGYETERGRVYLQYGPPNSRTVVDNEPSAFPYEVWWYYQIKGQRNVRFVFYNPDMVTNDYVLLHSDAFGENSDPQWRLQLFSRTTAFQNLDNSMNRGHFGSHLDDHLRNQ